MYDLGIPIITSQFNSFFTCEEQDKSVLHSKLFLTILHIVSHSFKMSYCPMFILSVLKNTAENYDSHINNL